jgi:hypothetical protein
VAPGAHGTAVTGAAETGAVIIGVTATGITGTAIGTMTMTSSLLVASGFRGDGVGARILGGVEAIHTELMARVTPTVTGMATAMAMEVTHTDTAMATAMATTTAAMATDTVAGADPRVAELQRRLTRAGYYHGAIDGIMGPRTRRAIRAYQQDHGYAG